MITVVIVLWDAADDDGCEPGIDEVDTGALVDETSLEGTDEDFNGVVE